MASPYELHRKARLLRHRQSQQVPQAPPTPVAPPPATTLQEASQGSGPRLKATSTLTSSPPGFQGLTPEEAVKSNRFAEEELIHLWGLTPRRIYQIQGGQAQTLNEVASAPSDRPRPPTTPPPIEPRSAQEVYDTFEGMFQAAARAQNRQAALRVYRNAKEELSRLRTQATQDWERIQQKDTYLFPGRVYDKNSPVYTNQRERNRAYEAQQLLNALLAQVYRWDVGSLPPGSNRPEREEDEPAIRR